MKYDNEIIGIFYNDPSKVCSINEISILLSRPYGTIYNYVHDLIKNRVLKSNIKGKATLCSLNYESQKTIELLSIISASIKEEFAKKEGVLSGALDALAKRINEKTYYSIFSIILFGSSVKGAAREKSDMDLFFISPSKNKYDEMIENECNALRMSYGRDVNPIIAEPRMYINMIRDREENVAKQIMRDKIIYFGASKFWELTMEGFR